MTVNVAQSIYESSPDARLAALGLDNVVLLPATTVAAAVAGALGEARRLPHNGFKVAEFLLKLTNAANDADDTLDVFIDTSIDDGTTWSNIVHFTQIVGNGADSRSFVATCTLGSAGDEFEVTSDVAAGGTPRNFLGRLLRVRWTMVDPTGSNATFTFSVTASFK